MFTVDNANYNIILFHFRRVLYSLAGTTFFIYLFLLIIAVRDMYG